MGRRGTILAAACCLLVTPASPAAAEILQERRGEEIVAVNTHEGARTERARGSRGPAARPGREAPPPEIGDLLDDASTRHGFDPALVRAVILAESGFDTMAVSKKGARGLMQLMPSTAARFGVRNVHDPGTNLEAGLAYLRQLVADHDGDVELALAAYNAGPEAVARYGGMPPYEETRRYIEKVRRSYGGDLDDGDWSARGGRIRLSGADRDGTPHYTNLRARRIIRPGGPSAGTSRRP